MVSWTGNSRAVIAELARQHGFGEGAGAAMAEAIVRAGGAMAQFHHPELGGMCQWSRGGMLMIGDMFNDGLKGRVRALAEGLAGALDQGALTHKRETGGDPFGHWWPDALGTPTSTGAQNGRRYAVFPDTRRLAIETDGQVRLYDTGAHRLHGASQQQGGGASLSFGSDRGTVGLDAFTEIASETAAAPSAPEPAPSGEPIAEFRSEAETPASMRGDTRSRAEAPRQGAVPASPPGDPITLIQRLAELKSAGILSEEEFAAKKAELLARL